MVVCRLPLPATRVEKQVSSGGGLLPSCCACVASASCCLVIAGRWLIRASRERSGFFGAMKCCAMPGFAPCAQAMCGCRCTCVCVHVHTHVSACVHECASVSAWVRVHVHVHVHVRVHMCVGACVSPWVRVWARVVHAILQAWMRKGERERPGGGVGGIGEGGRRRMPMTFCSHCNTPARVVYASAQGRTWWSANNSWKSGV